VRDIIDEVTYGWEAPEGLLPEITRQAYCDLFDPGSEVARIVMHDLVHRCKWMDETEHYDAIEDAKNHALRGLILAIKRQLNTPRIEELGE